MSWAKKYFLLSLTLLVASLNFNIFLNPLQLVTGGTQGLALLIHEIFKVSPSFIILVINVTTLIISYFTLSKETTYGTVVATFVYPLCVHLTSSLNFFALDEKLLLVYSVVAGIICGLTGGYVYKLGFSSGGVNTINLLVQKYLHISVAVSNFVINALIILFGSFFFGIEKGFYSIIVILVSSFIIGKMVNART